MPVKRNAPVEMTGPEFSVAGHALVNKIADFLDDIRQRPVTTTATSAEIGAWLEKNNLPETGLPAPAILSAATDLLLQHSLLNGHPKFMGYITSSAAPLGALADLLAAAVNPNVGAHVLSPVATAMEKQAVKWLAKLIGLPANFDGLLVSGGNMANFTAFFAAISIKLPGMKTAGIAAAPGKPIVYCSKTTHTWIEKAAALSGIGTDAIRWIGADALNRMNIQVLQATIEADQKNGLLPVMVIGTAGDVSTGAVDDLSQISSICKKYNCWFHIDGAYGMPAAILPELSSTFEGMNDADSIALDPHKWLYAPLEAGCTLVKDPNHLIQAYSSHPVYYNFESNDESSTRNFYEYGFQNSRGFRALKVWMLLQQAGRQGFAEMIATDIKLAGLFYTLADQHSELEAVTRHLSIVTLRYCPPGYAEEGLNMLNEKLVNELQRGGKMFLSNAVIEGKYCLRACIVNFRTSEKDIEEIIDIIIETGRKIAASQ